MRIKRLRRNLGVTGAIIAISVGVLLPVILSTSAGIVAIAVGESSITLIIGVLIVSFMAAATGGGVVATVLLGRRARLARLQSDLLANVSHELRTPLSAIRLHAQTLEQEEVLRDPEASERCVRTIVRETEWLETMIDRVLTWRAAEKDRDAMEMVEESVRDTVVESVDRFERMVDPSEVTLERHIETNVPVRHDRRAIGSVLINLLTNAYKYSGNDKRIEVRASDVEDGVLIEVQDNGMGMVTGEQERIFDPFYRVEGGDIGRAAGTGLGLAIVRHMVAAHDGDVFVESTEGEGSTFSIRLPRASGKGG